MKRDRKSRVRLSVTVDPQILEQLHNEQKQANSNNNSEPNNNNSSNNNSLRRKDTQKVSKYLYILVVIFWIVSNCLWAIFLLISREVESLSGRDIFTNSKERISSS